MSVRAGYFFHEDGSSDIALATNEPVGDEKGGSKVVVFSEPGGQYDIHHNVPDGKDGGEFSQSSR